MPATNPQSKTVDNSAKIKELSEKITTLKQADALAERMNENNGSTKEVKDKRTQWSYDKKKEIAELEKQLTAMQTP